MCVGCLELSWKSGGANLIYSAASISEEKDQGRRHREHIGPHGASLMHVPGRTGEACPAHSNTFPLCDITMIRPGHARLRVADLPIPAGTGGAGRAFTGAGGTTIRLYPNLGILPFGGFGARG